MATNLAQIAKQNGIRYFLISFVDLIGSRRAKLVPARAIKDMQRDGAGFVRLFTTLRLSWIYSF